MSRREEDRSERPAGPERSERPEDWARAVLAAERSEAAPETEESRWTRAWEALELPPTAPVPPEFSAHLAVRLRAERAAGAAPLFAASWMRVASAAALLAGIAVGSFVAFATSGSDAASAAALDDGWEVTSLSEEYLSALASPEAAFASEPTEGAPTQGLAAETP